jgi:hypothetical protein
MTDHGEVLIASSPAFGPVQGLPAPQEGVILIVSRIVAEAAKAEGRGDLVVPDGVIRDAGGGVLGCARFAR